MKTLPAFILATMTSITTFLIILALSFIPITYPNLAQYLGYVFIAISATIFGYVMFLYLRGK